MKPTVAKMNVIYTIIYIFIPLVCFLWYQLHIFFASQLSQWSCKKHQWKTGHLSTFQANGPDDLMKQDEENWGGPPPHAGMFQKFRGRPSQIPLRFGSFLGEDTDEFDFGVWRPLIVLKDMGLHPWNFSKSIQFLYIYIYIYHLLAQWWLVEALSPFELLAFADAAENHSTGGRRGTTVVQLQWFQWKSSSPYHP